MSHMQTSKQPKALYALALTEMWERFGIYIIQGLLIFYMTKVLVFTDATAYQTLGQFTALIYIVPVIGGAFADRVFGFRQSILIGAVLLLLGYSQVAMGIPVLFFTGLATVILGTGFLKPNISSFLGCFYQDKDSRRDAGFTLFYMFFNVGSFLATTSSGFVQERFGWDITFATAACGIVIALIVFVYGYRYYGKEGQGLMPTGSAKHAISWVLACFFLFGLIAVCYWLLLKANMGSQLLFVVGSVVALIVIGLSIRLPSSARNKVIALIIFVIISILFWSLFFQLFFTINLFVDRNVDRHLFGITLPAVLFISLEAFFIFTISPFFALMWRKLHQLGYEISTGTQFSLALWVIGAAMALLVMALHFTDINSLVNPIWIIGVYLLFTIAELLLSPIGLAMITRLAPPKWVGLMMGIWFMSLGFGGSLAGVLAKQASIAPELINNLQQTHLIYASAFTHYTLIAALGGLLTLPLIPWLKRLTLIS